MKRRTFLKTATLSSFALSFSDCQQVDKTHILTLSFDDGFKKSFYKIAEIYERYDLSACLNVIASGHLPGFQKVDDWILPELMGNFDDWNTLRARGHEIMPHSWKHLNLAKQPIEEAKALIIKCLAYFEEHLDGYENSKAVFNFPFNASTPELEQFVLSKVQAIRTRGETAVNTIPVLEPYRQGCRSMGPNNTDHWVEEQVNIFLDSSGGWLILNLHGLEDEGWGPLSTDYLNNLLGRMVKIRHLDILPTGEVLARTTS